MTLPLAYFLTWSCYGQRLHGDARGSVDDEHNDRGTPSLQRNTARESFERGLLKAPVFSMTTLTRQVVSDALAELCAERAWFLAAHNVRKTHVHIVVNCRGTVSPERALAQLKARATRNLRRERMVAADARLWAHHGSTRWINHRPGLEGAIGYVNDWQSGPRRELLERHKHAMRERLEAMRGWLRSQGLPADGLGVVVGESAEDRSRRVCAVEVERRN